jgi:hypothetical protein
MERERERREREREREVHVFESMIERKIKGEVAVEALSNEWCCSKNDYEGGVDGSV